MDLVDHVACDLNRNHCEDCYFRFMLHVWYPLFFHPKFGDIRACVHDDDQEDEFEQFLRHVYRIFFMEENYGVACEKYVCWLEFHWLKSKPGCPIVSDTFEEYYQNVKKQFVK